MNFTFPIQTVFQGNPVVDERCLFFIKVLELIKVEGTMKVENYYFATSYTIMDVHTNHQLMLKLYGMRLMGNTVKKESVGHHTNPLLITSMVSGITRYCVLHALQQNVYCRNYA